MESEFLVDFRLSNEPHVKQVGSPTFNWGKLLEHTAIRRIFRSGNRTNHSLGLLPGIFSRIVDRSRADVVHLHWIGNSFLSIPGIARIRKPLAWTMHDMWTMCGAEHYPIDDRWLSGYRTRRPPHERGIDINRLVWNRKFRHLPPIHLVCPSRWMRDMAASSPLTASWPATVIPNAIDTEAWLPIDQRLAREILRIPPDRFCVGFGAIGGCSDSRKGGDLLLETFRALSSTETKFDAIVFGQQEFDPTTAPGIVVHDLGRIADETSLRLAYAAMDVFVIPSRLDNLPNTGLEALASGRPVFGFDVGGLSDIVVEDVGGLAPAFDIRRLAELLRLASDPLVLESKSRSARSRAESLFDWKVVAESHLEFYGRLRESQGSKA